MNCKGQAGFWVGAVFTFWSSLGFAGNTGSAAQSDSGGCPPAKTPPVLGSSLLSDDSMKLSADMQQVLADANTDAQDKPAYSHLIDATFKYDYFSKGDPAKPGYVMGLSAVSANGQFTQQQLNQIMQATAPSLPGANPNSYPTLTSYLNYLKTLPLNLNQKLAILATLGKQYQQDYNFSDAAFGATSPQQIYDVARTGGRAGVCRDINALLAQIAGAMGMENVGSASGFWAQGPNGGLGGDHAVGFFQDPVTKDYYLVNYGEVVDTHTQDLKTANNISTRILGAGAAKSYIESRPGDVHAMTTDLGGWIRNTVEGRNQLKDDAANFQVVVSNRSITVNAEAATRIDDKSFVKAYFGDTNYEADDGGTYQIGYGGVVGNFEADQKLKNSLVDEVTYGAKIFAGAMRLRAPTIGQWESGDSGSNRTTAYVGADIKGSARINDLTGKLEINGRAYDMQPGEIGVIGAMPAPDAQGKFAVTYNPMGGPFEIGVSRVIDMDAATLASEKITPKTTYDKIDAILQLGSEGDAKGYIRVESDIYVMEGIDKNSATAFREKLKGAIPVGKLGQFYAVADIGRVVQNKTGDPYYNGILSGAFGAGWQKRISAHWTVGADGEASFGDNFSDFGDDRTFDHPDTQIPSGKLIYSGAVGISSQF